jgi:hypothetical protein
VTYNFGLLGIKLTIIWRCHGSENTKVASLTQLTCHFAIYLKKCLDNQLTTQPINWKEIGYKDNPVTFQHYVSKKTKCCRSFSGAFTKLLRNATTTFVMSVCLSVCLSICPPVSPYEKGAQSPKKILYNLFGILLKFFDISKFCLIWIQIMYFTWKPAYIYDTLQRFLNCGWLYCVRLDLRKKKKSAI